MISPAEKLLLEAWEHNQEAQFQILQALADLKEGGVDFDPKESISKAVSLQTVSSQKLTTSKTLI